MAQIEWNNRTLIAGVSGTGKTWFGWWWLREYQRQGKRSYYVILSDNRRDYNNPKHAASMRPASQGFKLIGFDKEHAARPWDWKRIIRTHRKLYIEVGNLVSAEIQALVDQLADAVWKLGNGLFVVDEAWLFLNRDLVPDSFERLARGGRKHGVDILAITQRVVDIHPRILSQFNVIVSFQLTEMNDRERLARYFAPINGRDPREVIATLKQGEYLIKVTETGQQEKNQTFGLA